MDPIGKANGNVAFICKKFYVLVLTKEPGLDHNNSGVNKSDIPVNKTNDQVNSGHTTFLRSKFNLIFDLLGTKLHKHLSKAKFIIAAPECFVKPLPNAVISVLKLRYKQIKNYNSKIHYFSWVKIFWPVQNHQSFIDAIKKYNGRNKTLSKGVTEFGVTWTDNKNKFKKHIIKLPWN